MHYGDAVNFFLTDYGLLCLSVSVYMYSVNERVTAMLVRIKFQVRLHKLTGHILLESIRVLSDSASFEYFVTDNGGFHQSLKTADVKNLILSSKLRCILSIFTSSQIASFPAFNSFFTNDG